MRSIFVYNPESGTGRLKRNINYILKELGKKYGDIEVVETTYAGHATEIARQSCGVYDYFFVSGGDGTLNEIVNGFGENENKPIVGYIPSGTINDVSRSLHLSTNIKKSVKTLLEGEVYSHDIFKVNDRYGIYVCCAGLFTETSYDTKRSAKKIWGKIAYFLSGVKDIFLAKPVHVELITEEEKINRNCSMLLILNTRSAAGFKVNQEAELNDGFVEVVLIHSHKDRVKFSEILRVVNFFFRGVKKYKNNNKITYRKLKEFTLNTEEGTIINLDGEKSGAGSFNFKVIRNGIKIIVPKK